MAPKKEWRKVVPQEIIEELSSDDDEKIQAPSSPSPASKPKEVKKKVEIAEPAIEKTETVVAANPKKRQLTEKQKEALEKGRLARDAKRAESGERKQLEKKLSIVKKKKEQMELEALRQQVAQMTGVIEANSKPEEQKKKKSKKRRHDSSSSESSEGEDSSSSSSSDDEEIQKPRKQRLSQAPPQRRVVFINH